MFKNVFFTIDFILCIWVQSDAQTNAKVIRVVDGDTYHILKNGKIIIVRLGNVDAPESKQQFGSEATKNVSDLILGKDVVFNSFTTNLAASEFEDMYGNRVRSRLSEMFNFIAFDR